MSITVWSHCVFTLDPSIRSVGRTCVQVFYTANVWGFPATHQAYIHSRRVDLGFFAIVWGWSKGKVSSLDHRPSVLGTSTWHQHLAPAPGTSTWHHYYYYLLRYLLLCVCMMVCVCVCVCVCHHPRTNANLGPRGPFVDDSQRTQPLASIQRRKAHRVR